MQIAGPALKRGWTVHLIDAMIEERPLEAVLAACADAAVFCSSCILGYQVFDGVNVSNAVRERYPHLAIWWGGWFPAAVPELFLNGAAADAVCTGQGEITFGNMLDAFGRTNLRRRRGLALLRRSRGLHAAPAVVGFGIPARP
jgi:hypothetical protein